MAPARGVFGSSNSEATAVLEPDRVTSALVSDRWTSHLLAHND